MPDELADVGLPLEPLLVELGCDLDPFDLIRQFAYNQPSLTCREGALGVRKRDAHTRHGERFVDQPPSRSGKHTSRGKSHRRRGGEGSGRGGSRRRSGGTPCLSGPGSLAAVATPVAAASVGVTCLDQRQLPAEFGRVSIGHTNARLVAIRQSNSRRRQHRSGAAMGDGLVAKYFDHFGVDGSTVEGVGRGEPPPAREDCAEQKQGQNQHSCPYPLMGVGEHPTSPSRFVGGLQHVPNRCRAAALAPTRPCSNTRPA